MPDPYAPRVARRAAAAEVEDDLSNFLLRLRRLGAEPDDVAAVAAHWDDFDDDWTPEKRDEIVSMGDAELMAELRRVYMEADLVKPEDDAEERELADQMAFERALVEAGERIGGRVGPLLDWVGSDLVRAQAVLTWETAAAGAKRKTLTGPLLALLAQEG